MNKKVSAPLIIVFFIITVFIGTFSIAAQERKNLNQSELCLQLHFDAADKTSFTVPQGSIQELYQDIISTLLIPYITSEVDSYYKNYLKELPGVDPGYISFQNIIRPNGDRTSEFEIKLLVKPYIGPHIVVGEDLINIRVKYGSIPKVERFEHIKSYKLPPNYQEIIIQ